MCDSGFKSMLNENNADNKIYFQTITIFLSFAEDI